MASRTSKWVQTYLNKYCKKKEIEPKPNKVANPVDSQERTESSKDVSKQFKTERMQNLRFAEQK